MLNDELQICRHCGARPLSAISKLYCSRCITARVFLWKPLPEGAGRPGWHSARDYLPEALLPKI